MTTHNEYMNTLRLDLNFAQKVVNMSKTAEDEPTSYFLKYVTTYLVK